MTVFSKKFPFSRPKFLMKFLVFFSHRPGFSDFPFLFPDFLYLYYVKCRIRPVYDPFLTRKTTISEKNSFMTLFFYSVRTFACIRQHYFSKYWGTDAWAVFPPQILGDRPRSPPLGLRLCVRWSPVNALLNKHALH